MIRGLYTAASGMIVENRKQENISHNMSNIGTTGFKQMMLISMSQDEGTLKTNNLKNTVGNLTLKVSVGEAVMNFTQGQLQPSNEPYDFALEGDGVFTLQGPQGERLYTRDGRFGVDNQGRLVSKEGYPVMVTNGKGGTGFAMVNDQSFTTSANGEFNVNGQDYKFLISELPDATSITKIGDSLYGYNGNANALNTNYNVHQFMKEGSNVDPTDEMVNMIATNRAFQMNSKVLMTMDETLQKSVNELGRV